MSDASAPQLLLEAQAASFGYGGEAVISGVDLRVHAGDLLGIVGPNGAGKTTLFRGLLGLLQPQAGHVRRAEVGVGYVPQREELDAVYPLSVREIVLMGAQRGLRGGRRFWRAPSREVRARAEQCMEIVGLRSAADAIFASLSGGQRQRILLARALMGEPRLLMLDEPTSGVDRGASRDILRRIADLNRERGVAVLLVAHQIDHVRELTEEVLLVRGGGVERGRTEELLSPESLESVFGGRVGTTGGGA